LPTDRTLGVRSAWLPGRPYAVVDCAVGSPRDSSREAVLKLGRRSLPQSLSVRHSRNACFRWRPRARLYLVSRSWPRQPRSTDGPAPLALESVCMYYYICIICHCSRDKGKLAVRRGRKVTGLSKERRPDCRREGPHDSRHPTPQSAERILSVGGIGLGVLRARRAP
jgi:hypothetical protein